MHTTEFVHEAQLQSIKLANSLMWARNERNLDQIMNILLALFPVVSYTVECVDHRKNWVPDSRGLTDMNGLIAQKEDGLG